MYKVGVKSENGGHRGRQEQQGQVQQVHRHQDQGHQKQRNIKFKFKFLSNISISIVVKLVELIDHKDHKDPKAGRVDRKDREDCKDCKVLHLRSKVCKNACNLHKSHITIYTKLYESAVISNISVVIAIDKVDKKELACQFEAGNKTGLNMYIVQLELELELELDLANACKLHKSHIIIDIKFHKSHIIIYIKSHKSHINYNVKYNKTLYYLNCCNISKQIKGILISKFPNNKKMKSSFNMARTNKCNKASLNACNKASSNLCNNMVNNKTGLGAFKNFKFNKSLYNFYYCKISKQTKGILISKFPNNKKIKSSFNTTHVYGTAEKTISI